MQLSPQVRMIDRFQLHALIAAGAAFVLAIVAFIEYAVLGFENFVLVGMVTATINHDIHLNLLLKKVLYQQSAKADKNYNGL